ncbi:glutathione S-transferase [Diaphorobacter sp. HDW4B]|uniref:glutathione S-transferase n=1 Tax=Diaphorobacter sp. HDW4B TaxID=2714925 RepID=UPI00140CE86D|nr:glutathione S-transferase [Diaphorobacter sp. HDW4B]QIL68924.1 glutathione S-transferase [Diaphorobacter sp. HDW4B]
MPTSLPILYSFRRCPYAIRARLALAYAGFSCELREIKLRDKPQAMLEVSPKGTVPVLVLPDGRVIEQSLEVMLHALQAPDARDADGWLQPTEGTLEQMLALIERNDQFFKPALDRSKYPDRYSAEQVAEATRVADEWLGSLDQRLADTGYLFGLNPSLADMALRPFVRQFAAIDKDKWTAKPWPHLQAWLQRFLDSALFAEVMETYPVWIPGTTGPVAFEGKQPATSAE